MTLTSPKTLGTAALCAAALATASFADVATAQTTDLSGIYVSETGRTRVRVSKCGSTHCGRIVSVTGETKDVNNPDPAKRGRDLVGLQMIWDITPGDRRLQRPTLQFQGRQDLCWYCDRRRSGHEAIRLHPRRPRLPHADLDAGAIEERLAAPPPAPLPRLLAEQDRLHGRVLACRRSRDPRLRSRCLALRQGDSAPLRAIA